MMRLPASLTLALFLVIAGAGPGAQVSAPADIRYPPLRAFEIAAPYRVTLSNGLVVLILEDRERPLVSVFARIDAGGRRDPPDQPGLASLAAQVLRGAGTPTRSLGSIDDDLDGRGMSFELIAGVDATVATVTGLRRDLDAALELTAGILRAPSFNSALVDEAKQKLRGTATAGSGSVQSVATAEFVKLVYGPFSPYARQPEPSAVDRLTLDALRGFHQQFYRPERTVLGIVGPVEPHMILERVRQLFGSWRKGAASRSTTEAVTSSPAGLYWIDRRDPNQAAIVVGRVALRADDPDFTGVQVLNELLARRVVRQFRDIRALGYAVTGSISAMYDHPGLFKITMLTRPGTVAAALKAIDDEVNAIRQVLASPDEFRAAQDAVLNSFVFGFDESDEVLLRQMALTFFRYVPDFDSRVYPAVKALRIGDVQQLARTWLDPQHLLRVVAGDASLFDKPLSELGPVIELKVGPAGEVKR